MRRSNTASFAPLLRTMYAHSAAVSAGLIGTDTTPSRCAPK